MVKLVGVAWVLCGFAGVGGGLVIACGSESQGCSFILIEGIDVTVSDAVTGSAICDAEVTATRGPSGATETLQMGVDCIYRGAYEGGSYQLHVQEAGYADAIRSVSVVETSGRCPLPVTTTVAIALSPK